MKLAALLDKFERREKEVPIDYLGFQIPDKFVVGYGLDFAERYRNLRFIAVLEELAASEPDALTDSSLVTHVPGCPRWRGPRTLLAAVARAESRWQI